MSFGGLTLLTAQHINAIKLHYYPNLQPIRTAARKRQLLSAAELCENNTHERGWKAISLIA